MSEIKLNPKLYNQDIDLVPTRNGYGEGVVKLGEKNPDVVVLTGDLADSTRASDFQKKFPDRFIEVGVAEQNMMGIAAGLALSGKVPFVSSYAVFVPGRCWDQLRVSVCYTKANVKVAGAHAGISVGPDGATHQALEDIATVRCLPNIVVVVPCDAIETRKAAISLGEYEGPAYFRFHREKTPVMTTEETPFKIGKAEIFREGKDVTLVGCGPILYQALVAAKELEKEGIDAEVINNHTIKPIDKLTLASSAKKTGAVVTVEEHQITGGLGGAVAEVLAENFPAPMERVGMPDHFGESGQPNELLEKYGMSVKKIKESVHSVIKRKK